MILIADSGSTKCEWILLSDDFQVVREIKTMGFNPYFHSSTLISSVLKGSTSFAPLLNQVKKIFYYGAGCYTDENRNIVRKALKDSFTNASIEVKDDISACAYANFRGEPLIGCVLGTGSNTIYFDGKESKQKNPSLGFILGNEGGGSYFGGELLRAYFYKKLPQKFIKPFEDEFAPDLNSYLENIYEDEQAYVFLAGFMKFVTDNRDDKFFIDMTNDGFRKFLELHVLAYEEAKEIKVHFVGAVSYFFQDQLKKLCKEYEIKTGNFLRKPVTSLIDFHQNYYDKLIKK